MIQAGEGQQARERFRAILEQNPGKEAQAARAVVKVLNDAYDDFRCVGVHQFCMNMDQDLPEPVVDPIQRQLEPRLARTSQWSEALRDVTRERLTRECRDNVILKNTKKSAALGARLILRARNSDEIDDYGHFLGMALADLERDRDTAARVVGMITPVVTEKLNEEAAAKLAQAFERGCQMGRSSLEGGPQAWTRRLTETALRLREALPGLNELGAPSEEQVTRFYEEAHAILRAGLFMKRPDDLIDALMILWEYCPVDEAAHEHVAGVEQSMFINLGPRARLTCVRALRQLGQNETLRKAVLALVESDKEGDRRKLIVGICGGLSHEAFFPYLKKALGDADNKLQEAWIYDALGRNAAPEATDLLQAQLKAVVKRIGEAGNMDRAFDLLKAIARQCRAPGLDVNRRNEMIRHTVDLVKETDRKIVFQTVFLLFSNRVDEIERGLKEWAAARCVETLWGQPLKEDPRAAASAVGWRQPVVTATVRLGSAMLPTIIETADRFKTRYSGAMAALAEIFQNIGDPRVVPLLESMIRCALLHEEDQRGEMYREKVRDAATGTMNELDRDDLVHTLVHTLIKVGDREGLNVALDLADQMQAGRIPNPGEKTSTILLDTKMEHGEIDEVNRRAERVELDAKEWNQAYSDAGGGLFTSKSKQIAAIAKLGQTRDPDAIEVLLEALGDKDPLVTSAAHTALAQYMHPLPDEEEYTRILNELLAKPKILKGRLLDNLIHFLRTEAPKNKPYDGIFARQVFALIEDEELRFRVETAIKKPNTTGEPATEEASSSDTSDAKPTLDVPPVSMLDRKREYLQARKAWIEGGKKGDPPTPPK